MNIILKILNQSILKQRARVIRYVVSAFCRLFSGALEEWGGITSNLSPLVIEGVEEINDGLFFAASSIEAGSKNKKYTQRARKYAKVFAGTAAVFSTIDTSLDIYNDHGTLFESMKGINLYSHQYEAAIGALAINSVVYFVNRKGRKSSNASDKFAWRDSIKDSVIPAAVMVLGATKAPHLAEYGFEFFGVGYGWYNVKKLFSSWKPKAKKIKV